MATKMNAATAKRVKALKINAKNEEEAREKLLEILVENGIEGMEEEDTDTILDIAESFVEDDNAGDDEPQTEEEENDELAEEVEEEEEEEKPKKPAKKASKKVEEPEEEEEGDEFDDMDRSSLKAYIKDNELDITVKKSMTDDDIREAIRAEVGEEEEEDEKPAPKSKASTKPAEKAAPKKEDKKAPAKSEKKEAKPAAGKRGTKLDPKNNEDDRKAFAPLKKLFPESEYAYAWVASAGVTIKHKGKNSQRSMVLIENCSKQADGSIKCNLYLLTFTKQTEVLDKAGIDYEPCWSGAPLIKGITLDEALEIITDLMEHITATVQKIDKKLGENRKKMEENLDKKKGTKKAAKVEEPEEEEEEDDEEEEEAPKKKSSKSAPAKKAAKKVVEEDDEEEEDEEEDEAPAPKKKATSKSAPAKKTTKKK